jgi:hypothetical protein
MAYSTPFRTLLYLLPIVPNDDSSPFFHSSPSFSSPSCPEYPITPSPVDPSSHCTCCFRGVVCRYPLHSVAPSWQVRSSHSSHLPRRGGLVTYTGAPAAVRTRTIALSHQRRAVSPTLPGTTLVEQSPQYGADGACQQNHQQTLLDANSHLEESLSTKSSETTSPRLNLPRGASSHLGPRFSIVKPPKR